MSIGYKKKDGLPEAIFFFEMHIADQFPSAK
jgi:hypothetical protein